MGVAVGVKTMAEVLIGIPEMINSVLNVLVPEAMWVMHSRNEGLVRLSVLIIDEVGRVESYAFPSVC